MKNLTKLFRFCKNACLCWRKTIVLEISSNLVKWSCEVGAVVHSSLTFDNHFVEGMEQKIWEIIGSMTQKENAKRIILVYEVACASLVLICNRINGKTDWLECSSISNTEMYAAVEESRKHHVINMDTVSQDTPPQRCTTRDLT